MSAVGRAAAEAVYRAYIAAENGRDRSGMERCLSPDLSVSVNGVAQLADRDADAAATDRLLDAYPDYVREIEHVSVDAGEGPAIVVAEWTMRGSADPAAGVPRLAVTGCTVATVDTRDGTPVIVAARLYTDPAALDHIL